MILNFHDPQLDELRPEALEFTRAFRQRVGERPPLDFSTPEGVARARDVSAWRFDDDVELAITPEDRVVHCGTDSVPIRVLCPTVAPRAVYLDIHGGGFFLGSASMGDARNASYAEALGVAVVSVDYRLAPEHSWPAGPDDCETAARWLLEHADAEFGTSTLLIGGASAGANLSVATLLRLRDKLDAATQFVGANLLYGPYDLSNLSPSGRLHEAASNVFRPQYMGHVPKAERINPDISPLYGDLHGLPPALFTVGTLDGLYEDNLAMAVRWAAAGNECELDVYPDAPHAFDMMPIGMAAAARSKIVRWLDRRLA
jgi:acetyl esterase/lipase